MFISRQPIRGRAAGTVSAHPNRRRIPLKRQNLTALFARVKISSQTKINKFDPSVANFEQTFELQIVTIQGVPKKRGGLANASVFVLLHS